MKWKEKSAFLKVTTVVFWVSIIVYMAVSILNHMDILTGVDLLEDILWFFNMLSLGILEWKWRQDLAIISFILAGSHLLFTVIFLFV